MTIKIPTDEELIETFKKSIVAKNNRIAELEKKLEDVQNTMATENVDLGMENHKLKEQIKELKTNIQLIEKNTDYLADKCKELEDSNDCKDRGIKWLNERIKELESNPINLINTKDRLPTQNEINEFMIGLDVRVDGTIDRVYQVYFIYKEQKFYKENAWGDKEYTTPSSWMIFKQSK